MPIRNLFFIFCMMTQLAAANPSFTNQIQNNIHRYQQEQISLLEKLVNINSGTNHLKGVYAVGENLKPYLEKLGFKVYWAPMPANMQRAASLIAEHSGQQGKRLLLIGHLDTVFPSNSTFQQFKRNGNVASGPGVIDAKGGDVVMLYALKALHDAGALKDRQITIVLTGDEENSGKPTAISRKALIDAAKKSDFALDFEWSITLNSATIARRGISNWVLETKGQEAHSSEIFQTQAGFGAIYELARILESMRQQLSHEQYSTLNPGLTLAGNIIHYDKEASQGNVAGKNNVIAKTSLTIGDLRFINEAQKINMQHKIIKIVAAHLPGTDASIQFQDAIPAMPPTPGNIELLKKYNQASLALGDGIVQPLEPSSRGAGDISHVASFVKGALAGLGPIGTGAHSEKETIDLRSLPIQTERAALLFYRLTHDV